MRKTNLGKRILATILVLEEAANENDVPVALHMVYANVQILDVLYGDVNGDGQISLTDVLRLRKYMADRDPVTGEFSVVLGPQQ